MLVIHEFIPRTGPTGVSIGRNVRAPGLFRGHVCPDMRLHSIERGGNIFPLYLGSVADIIRESGVGRRGGPPSQTTLVVHINKTESPQKGLQLPPPSTPPRDRIDRVSKRAR